MTRVAVVLLVLATARFCVALEGTDNRPARSLLAGHHATQGKSRRCPRNTNCNLPAYSRHPCCHPQPQPLPYIPPPPPPPPVPYPPPLLPCPIEPNCTLPTFPPNPCCPPPMPLPQPLPFPPPQPLPYLPPPPVPYLPPPPPPLPMPYPSPSPPCPPVLQCNPPTYPPNPCCQPPPPPPPPPITYPPPQPIPYPPPPPMPYPPPSLPCPAVPQCNSPTYPPNPCCRPPPQPIPYPVIDTRPPTWIPPIVADPVNASDDTTTPVVILPLPSQPVQPWYPPPRPVYPPMPTRCGMNSPCRGCPAPPVTPAPCPFAGSQRIRRRAQRRCFVDSHCPEGSSCCRSGCSAGKSICVPSVPLPPPDPSPNMVRVSVVMTSASNQALWFLKAQLTPFFHALPHLLNLELIPYGSVAEDGECQFGLGDCLGNWMVSCAGQHLPDSTGVQLAFTTCLMDHTAILQADNFTAIMDAALQCAADFPDKITDLYNCGVSEEGYQLFKDAGRRQLQLAPVVMEVPVVALNEVAVVRRGSQLGRFPELLCRELQAESSAVEYCQLIEASKQEAALRV